MCCWQQPGSASSALASSALHSPALPSLLSDIVDGITCMQVCSGRKALTTGRCLLLAHGAMFTDTALLGTDTGTHQVLCRADTPHTCCCRPSPQQHSATVALVGFDHWSVFVPAGSGSCVGVPIAELLWCWCAGLRGCASSAEGGGAQWH